MTIKGASIISEVIQVNKTLQKLNISNCAIPNRGVVVVSKSLKCNDSLKELNMSHNEVSKINEILVFLEVNTTLQKLDMSFCGIRSKMAVEISKSYKNNKTLQELIISWKNDHIIVNTADKSCNLPKMKMNDTDAQVVSNLLHNSMRLNRLDVSSNKISDKGIVSIAGFLNINITLQQLDISHNSIAIEGALKVAEIININKSLRKLNISHCSIPDIGIVAICNFLTSNTMLQELNVSHNNILITGANKIAEVIQINKILQKLNLSHCGIPDDGAEVISESYITNRVLEELKISWKNDRITINTADPTCDLSNKNIGDNGAKILSNLLYNSVKIKQLYISSNRISDYSVLAIDVNKVDRLMCNKTLLELDMSHNTITLEGTKHVAEFIKNNITLQKLDISYCGIPDDGAVIISESYKNNKTLQELVISWKDDKVIVNTAHTAWNTSRKKIGNIGVSILVNLLNSKVKKLDISHNSISEDGILLISDYFMSQCSIEELNLSYNIITTKGAEEIAKFVKINHMLRKLNISNCGILDGDAVVISEAYKTHKKLQLHYSKEILELVISWGDDKFSITTSSLCCDVSGMKLDNTGARILSNLLSVACHLIKLDISHNDLCDDEISMISCCLYSNYELEDLIISHNNVTDVGIRLVFDALRGNPVLKTINISFNHLSNDAAVAISNFIMKHRALIRCNLAGNNDITACGKKTIMDSTNGCQCRTIF